MSFYLSNRTISFNFSATEHEEAGNLRTDPPSMDICSSEVIKGLFEKEPADQQHFALRKKPKSEALLQEIKKRKQNLKT